MGGLLGRHKKENGKKLCGYQICPSNQQKIEEEQNTEKQIVRKQDEINNAIKPGALEWTDVSLHVPEKSTGILDKVVITPVPPPRKHRVKMENIPVEKIIPIMIKPAEKTNEKLLTKQKSVEEEIIIPKKEPVHICDGTHSHVTNIVNGKIIHNEIITHKPPQHIHTRNAPPIFLKNNPTGHLKSSPTAHFKNEHNALKSIPVERPKNRSTVSLPNYEELIVKSKHGKAPDPKISNPKKKPQRHISVMSLPESKVSLSTTTAARLENYIMRCKSFGQLPPKQLLEKLQHQEDFSSESDDSWEGLGEWNMEILEHEGRTQLPIVPRSRLEAPTSNLSHMLVNEKMFPDTIEEVDEVTKKNLSPVPHNKLMTNTKNSDGRRESIDDFFEAKPENPFLSPSIQELKDASALGRRGSDGVYGYDKKCYPFKNPENDPNFKSDTFFSNSMLQHESQKSPNNLKMRRKSAGAALHRIDSVSSDTPESPIKDSIKMSNMDNDLLKTFQDFYDKNKDIVKDKSEKIVDTLDKSTYPVANACLLDPTPINSREKVEHSGLLKFIQDNSADSKLKPSTGDKITPHEELTSVTQ